MLGFVAATPQDVVVKKAVDVHIISKRIRVRAITSVVFVSAFA